MSANIAPITALGQVAIWIDGCITTMLSKTITPLVTSTTAQILPLLSICLSISLIWYGWLICAGAIQTPAFDALRKSVSILVIVSIAGAGGLYQKHIMGAMLELPTDLMQILTGTSKSPAQIVDEAAKDGATLGTLMQERAPKGIRQIPKAFVFLLAALIIALCTAALSALGLLALIIVKVGMGLVVVLGPLCILALLFESTHDYFRAWTHQAVHYAIHAGVYLLVFTFIIGMFRELQKGCMTMAEANEMNILSMLIAIAIFILCARAMLELVSDVVGGISGGMGGSYTIPKLGKVG